ncbi:MAG: hypothetical protein RBT60_06740 [Candidatus Krumholzibacteria bacterium]|jgi:opacity protein-like surface antigen|nr:hypothetical protein [Candidatus Krumholzibacteria bacterium]
MRRSIAVSLVILLAAAAVPSTCRAERGWAGGHFDIAGLRGDFGTQVGRNGYGLSGEGFVQIGRESPLALGLRAGWMNHGHESERVPLSPTVPGVWVNLDRDNNLVIGQLVLRLQMWQGDVRPYGEAFIGLNYLYTKTSVSAENTGVEFAGSNNWNDTAFAWGAGGGVLLRIARAKGNPVFIDLGAALVNGGRAQYLAEGDVQIVDDRLVYYLHDSYTDYVLWRVGVVVAF